VHWVMTPRVEQVRQMAQCPICSSSCCEAASTQGPCRYCGVTGGGPPLGAVLVDSSSGTHGTGGSSSSRVGGGSYNWAAAWQAVRRLLPGMSGS
jgi:hypothetical protein